MPDSRLPRGALARLGLLALVVLFFVAPRLVRAQEGSGSSCQPLAKLEAEAKSAGGSPFAHATDAQWQFARGLYVATPPVSSEFPPGDSAMISTFPDGSAQVLFIDDGEACNQMMLAKRFAALVMGAGAGDITHAKAAGQPL
ncbi:MAG: hypothetical protein P4L76_18100 [Beijerinckiaceae bacterium]|nr:hypothetical protein [Beijerinckiaceae bacterium]